MSVEELLFYIFFKPNFTIMNNDNLKSNNTVADNKESSIHDFDFSLICEYFSSIKRQGPGSDEATRKALGVQMINAICRPGKERVVCLSQHRIHRCRDMFPSYLWMSLTLFDILYIEVCWVVSFWN